MRRAAIVAIAGACSGAHLADPRDGHRPDAASSATGDAPNDTAACTSARVVYLDFDGVTLTRGPSDATTNTAVWLGVAQATIPAYLASAPSRAQMIHDVTANVTATLSSIPATVVTTRPASGSYVMIVFGGTPQTVNVPYIDAVAHLDCGDADPNDVGLVFDNVSPLTAQKVADYAVGAIAFGLGLTGTHAPDDCLCGWANGCQQNATACTLSSSIGADLRCNGQTNPQDEVATFRTAFCR
jgi:hypothetical protein